MVGAGADLSLAPCSDHISRAVLIGTEERPASHHALRLTRLVGIERGFGPLRIPRDATSRRELRVVVRTIPVADPFPCVASDIVEAVPVRWKLRDWSKADERVFT